MISSSSPRSSESSNLLAPGFRFHPTDEELVSYYLKRKVSNLPLRVDAIAEIDLYNWEPSDLPALSRLRSRDMEWYFFSPLDRKYSNRSRTNRATAGGYWKTTGKDRPVKHRLEVVGMKKTLVFHEGRAPRGQRTNWVMHEYRLESDNSQGSFVVCRIFQKNGAGPQNGAQYGAPFVEEEWEGAEVAKNEGGALDVVMYHSGEQDSLPSDEEKDLLGDLQENTGLMTSPEGQTDNQTAFVVMDTEGHADDMTTLLDDVFEWDKYINLPGLQDGPNASNNMGEDSGIARNFCSPSDQNDEFVELKDIFYNANGPCAGNSFDGQLAVQFDLVTAIGANEGNPFTDDVFNPVFYDAPPNNDTCYTRDIFTDTNGTQFSPAADLSGFDVVDDLLAYFDATDNNLLDDVFDSSETQPNFVSEVEGSGYHDSNANLPAPGMNTLSGAVNLLESAKNEHTVETDMQVNEGWNTALRKRVVDMLGSISAPPAKAECSGKGKAKAVETFSESHSSSSIHVSAGVVRVHDMSIMGRAGSWTLQKNGESSFLLSYGAGKSATEMQSGALRMLLHRGGFCIFSLSVLILCISFKIMASKLA